MLRPHPEGVLEVARLRRLAAGTVQFGAFHWWSRISLRLSKWQTLNMFDVQRRPVSTFWLPGIFNKSSRITSLQALREVGPTGVPEGTYATFLLFFGIVQKRWSESTAKESFAWRDQRCQPWSVTSFGIWRTAINKVTYSGPFMRYIHTCRPCRS